MTLAEIWQLVSSWLLTEGLKIVLGLVVLFILFKVINVICKTIAKRTEKRKLDPTVSKFFLSCLRVILKVLAVVGYVGYIGIETSGIAAAISSIGIALGLALQGSLANFAGGIVIIVTRPFKVGDYIEAQGMGGTVDSIHSFYTHIITGDNRVVLLPNGALASGVITNFSTLGTRRVEWRFSVSYDADLTKAQAVIRDCISASEYMLLEPAPFVGVLEHADSAIVIVARAWTTSADYWTYYFEMNENVKNALDNAGIVIPYNTIDVHVTAEDKK